MSKLGRFSRTELLLGEAGMEKLAKSTVAIFGVGGVGSFVAEGLARAGVGHLVLIDNDLICLTNINRQIHATSKTVGKKKTETMKERILDINPKAVVDTIDDFYLPDQADRFFAMHYDYVVDAIDTVTGKIDLVLQCRDRHIPIICSMGAGNKLDPTKFEVTDIERGPLGPRHAQEAQGEPRQEAQGRLFQGKAPARPPERLRQELHLPAGQRAQLRYASRRARQHLFRAVGRRAHHCG